MKPKLRVRSWDASVTGLMSTAEGEVTEPAAQPAGSRAEMTAPSQRVLEARLARESKGGECEAAGHVRHSCGHCAEHRTWKAVAGHV